MSFTNVIWDFLSFWPNFWADKVKNLTFFSKNVYFFNFRAPQNGQKFLNLKNSQKLIK